MAANSKMFREELCRKLHEAEQNGASFLEVKAGDLHRIVGGYPGADARMPICCSVMKSVLRKRGGSIVQEPPKGNGASLTIRYQLSPRATSPKNSTLGNSESATVRQTGQVPIDQDIYRKLISIAEAKTTITYQELASVHGLTMDNPASRARLADLLGQISAEEYKNGRPLLSVLVVNKASGMPGQGFFHLAKRLGSHDQRDDLTFFVSELKKVHEYWASFPNETADEDEEEFLGEFAETDLIQPHFVEQEEPTELSQSAESLQGGVSGGKQASSETPEESCRPELAPGFFSRIWNRMTARFRGK